MFNCRSLMVIIVNWLFHASSIGTNYLLCCLGLLVIELDLQRNAKGVNMNVT